MSELDLERRVISKVTRRYVPLLFICFVVAFLDRVNVGFAALTMNHDIGLSSSAFGLGAGLFFVSYFLLEVPSNIILERVGARRWIARIMFTWGLLSACMTLVKGDTSFYAIRFLLGAAEAGFFPGVLFFLTLWVPAAYRARVVAGFLAAMPVASVIGSPTASLLLQMNGALGLHGWQWMFLIDALPAIVLTPLVLRALSDHPKQATWLTEPEHVWLERRLAADRAAAPVNAHGALLSFLCTPKMMLLALAYFGVVGFNYGLSFFLPQIIHQFGLSVFQTGLVNALPFALAVIGMRLWGRHSDHRGERRFHLLAPVALASIALAASTLNLSSPIKFVLLCLAIVGAFSALVIFWTYISELLGAGAAAGIAMINSVGNLSGFAYLYAIGLIKDLTGSFAGGLQLIAFFGLLAIVVIYALSAGKPAPLTEGRI